ncbi:MAG: FtsW/RodA/SpoVE family cell cycle protein [Chthonomonas sp.]|nr:FtsW/RodA/SpoVE family cell cycle protein [Chthonomonas sp.]
MVRTPRLKFRVGDPQALFLAALCTVIGIFLIYTAGFARALDRDGIMPREVLVQIGATVLMVFVAAACSRLDIEWWRKRAGQFFAGAFVLLVLVMAPVIGYTQNGATRWIKLGPINLQPSEIAKVAVVLFLAATFCYRKPMAKPLKSNASTSRKLDWLWQNRGVRALPLLMVLAVALKIELEPDLGTAAVIMAIAAGMLFVGGVSKKSLAILTLVGTIGLVGLVKSQAYRMERILNHGNRWEQKHIDDIGFQTTRAEAAMAGGGVVGAGPGAGWAKHFLPAATTDYIMATIGEEFGLIGSLFVIGLLGLLVFRFASEGHRLLSKADKLLSSGSDPTEVRRLRFAGLVLLGLAFWIGIQTAVNVMMANGTLPSIGIPLPFFSSGGSSLIALWIAVGLGQSAAAVEHATQPQEAYASNRNRRGNRRAHLPGA